MNRLIHIAFAAVGLAGASASASEGQPIVITPENVELTNAGNVKFPVDFTQLSTPGDVEQTTDIKLWFHAEGKVVQCDMVKGETANATALCAQAMARAQLSFAPGFSQPLRRGFVIVRVMVTPSRIYQLEPDHPIDFSGGNAAVSMTLALSTQPNGAASPHCSVASGFLPWRDQTKLSDEVQSQICTAFLDRRANGEEPCRALGSPASPLPSIYQCHIAARPGAFTSSVQRHAAEVPEYVHADVRYPPDDTPPADRLGAQDGQLQPRIGSSDYPPLMLRLGLSGRVQMLLGVRSDGGIATCRPLVSSGTAALDNATCALLARRGRYEFRTTPAYQGLRYATTSISWALPTSSIPAIPGYR